MDWEDLKGRVARALYEVEGYPTPSRFNKHPAQPGELERWCWKEIGLALHTVGPGRIVAVFERAFSYEPAFPELAEKMAEVVPRIMGRTPKTLKEIKQYWRDRSEEVGDREDPLVSIERGLMMADWAGAQQRGGRPASGPGAAS